MRLIGPVIVILSGAVGCSPTGGGGDSGSDGTFVPSQGGATTPLPNDIRVRAQRHATSHWGDVQLGAYETLYRPDVEGPAYYEVEILRGGTPIAATLLSTGRHATPIVEWRVGGGLTTRDLRVRAEALGREPTGFVRMGSITAAVDKDGEAIVTWPFDVANWRDYMRRALAPNNSIAQLYAKEAAGAWDKAALRTSSPSVHPLDTAETVRCYVGDEPVPPNTDKLTWEQAHAITRPPEYRQMQSNDALNKIGWPGGPSGCGATAWAMIIGWIDQRAAEGDPRWSPYGGLYRVGGQHNTTAKDAPAPYHFTAGAQMMTNRIREVLNSIPWGDFFDATSTDVYQMGYIGNYLADVGLKENLQWPTFHIGGAPDDSIKDNVEWFLCRQNVPAIIGFDHVDQFSIHYGVAEGFEQDADGTKYFQIIPGVPPVPLPIEMLPRAEATALITTFPATFFAGSLLPNPDAPAPTPPPRNFGIEVLYADYGDRGYFETFDPFLGNYWDYNEPEYINNAVRAVEGACDTRFDCVYTVDASNSGGFEGRVPHDYQNGGNRPQDDMEQYSIGWRCGTECPNPPNPNDPTCAPLLHRISVDPPSWGKPVHLTCPFAPQSSSQASTTPQPDGYNWNSLPVQQVDKVTLTLTAPAAFLPGYAPVTTMYYSFSGPQSGSGSSTTNPVALQFSQEGITSVSFHGVDADGNAEPQKSAVVQIDNTKPTIASAITPQPNGAGWNNTPVVVKYQCSDALSGIATLASDVPVLSEGRNQPASGTCFDKAMNPATATAYVSLDMTPPVGTYSGNQGTYSVDQTVAITCSATDNLSGVSGFGADCSSTPNPSCGATSGPAYTFAVGKTGTNVLSFGSSDVANNCGVTQTSFKVVVTYQSLCSLVQRFSTKQSVSAALCNKLFQAESAPNPNAKDGKFNAFKNQVDAQSGKAISSHDAQILDQLADLCLQEC